MNEMARLLWMCGVRALVVHLPWCREGGIFLSFKHVTFEEKVPLRQCIKLQALREILYISSSIEGVL